MDPHFDQLIQGLHPLYIRLTTMPAVSPTALPPDVPKAGIYLFSEGQKHLYVGRSNGIRRRIGQHSRPGSRTNEAAFAVRLAHDATSPKKSAMVDSPPLKPRKDNEAFRQAFTLAKDRIRQMDLRFVEETDPIRQALLEIYVSVALNTKYNDFDNH